MTEPAPKMPAAAPTAAPQEAVRQEAKGFLATLKENVDTAVNVSKKLAETTQALAVLDAKIPESYKTSSAIATERDKLVAAAQNVTSATPSTVEQLAQDTARLTTLVEHAVEVPALETRIAAVETQLGFAAGGATALHQGLEAFKAGLASTTESPANLNSIFDTLKPQLQAWEEFGAEIAAHPEARDKLQPHIEKVKNGGDPAVELAAVRATLAVTQDEAANTAEDPTIEEDKTTYEKLMEAGNSIGGDGKFASLKAPMAKIAAALAGLAAVLCKIPFIGNSFRGTLVPNEMLAAKGDEVAKKAVIAEKHFKKFGLKKTLANSVGMMPAKKAVEEITKKPEGVDKDRTTQVTQFIGQIQAHMNSHPSATTDKTTILDIMASPDFKPRYRANLPAPEPAAPQAAPLVATAPTPSATPPAVSPPAAVASTTPGASPPAPAAPPPPAAKP